MNIETNLHKENNLKIEKIYDTRNPFLVIFDLFIILIGLLFSLGLILSEVWYFQIFAPITLFIILSLLINTILFKKLTIKNDVIIYERYLIGKSYLYIDNLFELYLAGRITTHILIFKSKNNYFTRFNFLISGFNDANINEIENTITQLKNLNKEEN